jgi:hypothetical protein
MVPHLVSAYYLRVLDHVLGAMLRLEFTTGGREITDYAVVLLLALDGSTETIRVYDGAHGHNEMHRYTRSEGKHRGSRFMPVLLEKECAPQSRRSSAAMAR